MKLATCGLLFLGLAGQPAQGKELTPSLLERESRQLSDQGIAAYRIGDYQQALDRFQEAYRLSLLPDLLFNLGQAYRRNGECASARLAYQRFLQAQPGAFNRWRVEQRIVEMRRCEESTRATVVKASDEPRPEPTELLLAPPPAPAPAPPTAERTLDLGLRARPTAAPNRRLALRASGLVAIAMGLALGAAGIYYSANAISASNQVDRLFRDGGQWNDRYRSLESSGQSDTNASAALYTIGGAAVVGGATLVWLGWRSPR